MILWTKLFFSARSEPMNGTSDSDAVSLTWPKYNHQIDSGVARYFSSVAAALRWVYPRARAYICTCQSAAVTG